jgi:hypothetical protein
MGQPLWQRKPGVEFKPAANITCLYDLVSREYGRRKPSDQCSDENVVQQVILMLAGKQALCLGDFAGQRWVIG